MDVTAAQTDPCLPFLPYGIKYEIFDTHVSLNYIKRHKGIIKYCMRYF